VQERKINIPLFERAPIKTYRTEKDDFPYNGRLHPILSKKCHKCNYPLLNYGVFSNKFNLKSSYLFTEYSPMFKIMNLRTK
jgi:hypothetical protein